VAGLKKQVGWWKVSVGSQISMLIKGSVRYDQVTLRFGQITSGGEVVR
jgi:hypothetical protein